MVIFELDFFYLLSLSNIWINQGRLTFTSYNQFKCAFQSAHCDCELDNNAVMCAHAHARTQTLALQQHTAFHLNA